MGTFGETVSSLVDIYARCISLLKLSERHTTKLGEKKGASDSAPELQHALRKSRNKVRRAYSSRLSDGGQSFEKGDTASRSSLRRIIRKLTTTLSNLQSSFSKNNRPTHSIDYASLVSLCESSRSDALRTMTDLSSRISTSSASTVSRGSRRSRRTRSDVARTKEHHARRHGRRECGESGDKRVSMISTSTNSTKLGEVRRRHSRRDNGHVAYPRHSFERGRTEREPEKKRWWKVFN